jgi:sulfate adenylyltransferase subunit 2
MAETRSDLDALAEESIFILREAAAACERPVLLYSMGKDSSILLHLARKAFAPAPLPFPLLHVDTGWKFREMYALRERIAAEPGIRLIVHRNAEAEARDINPFDHGPLHTQMWKTEGLRQALHAHGFDAAIGGARRDEEKSRAKERVFSFRAAGHRWDPRGQRPELWRLYNALKAPGESFRIFPLSNWTERDVWRFIAREAIEVLPLYFAARRKVVEREGMLIPVDDERFRLGPAERVEERRVRFRTLGCYPLSGAIESEAASPAEIIEEMQASRSSERQGRLIDREAGSSMERKKREGYF